MSYPIERYTNNDSCKSARGFGDDLRTNPLNYRRSAESKLYANSHSKVTFHQLYFLWGIHLDNRMSSDRSKPRITWSNR